MVLYMMPPQIPMKLSHAKRETKIRIGNIRAVGEDLHGDLTWKKREQD